MSQLWIPQPVSGRVRSYNDYPCVDLNIPAFSERAVEALRDMLEQNGELLPLVSKIESYYAYNITSVVDALDQEKSEFEWYENKSILLPSRIARYEFLPEKINGLSIFRIVESPSQVFVTNQFVERVVERRLRGFVFRKLWPHGFGKTPIEADHHGEMLTKESVVIEVRIGKSKPSKVENLQVHDLMDRIDSWLTTAEREGSFFGMLEGHKCTHKWYKLYLSCPNANKLASFLALQTKSTHIESNMIIIQRYGTLDDPGCREEPFSP